MHITIAPRPRIYQRQLRVATCRMFDMLGENGGTVDPGERCASVSNAMFDGRVGTNVRIQLISRQGSIPLEPNNAEVRRIVEESSQMETIRTVTSAVLPWLGVNCDTNQVIPAQLFSETRPDNGYALSPSDAIRRLQRADRKRRLSQE